jgi:hypothetical protein
MSAKEMALAGYERTNRKAAKIMMMDSVKCRS